MNRSVLEYKETKNEQIFAEIWVKFEPYISHLVDKPLNTVKTKNSYVFIPNIHEKDELQSELYMKLLECIEEYEEEQGPFENFAKSTLRWHSHNIARKMIKHKNEVVEYQEEYHDLTKEEDEELEEKVDVSPEMIEAVNSLPNRQREVIRMYYYYNLTNAEIAESLGLDRRVVSKHRKLGLKNLKKRLT